jgi:hypothetical protein
MQKYYTVVLQGRERECREWGDWMPDVRPKYPNYWLSHEEAALWKSGDERGAIDYRR